MTAALRIVIADDHAMFREGLRSALERHADLEVVGEAADVDDVARCLATTPCDVLVLDLDMDRSAIPAVPALARHAAVVGLTTADDHDEAIAAARAGARAVVCKRSPIAILCDAIRAVAAGESRLPRAVQQALTVTPQRQPAPPISARERQIIHHVALGQRNAEVARLLFISEETVKKHLTAVFQKLGLRDRVQLTRYAIRSGIVSSSERRI